MQKKKNSVSPFDVSGKVALITGGRRGLGLAMAKGLVNAHAKLAVIAFQQRAR